MYRKKLILGLSVLALSSVSAQAAKMVNITQPPIDAALVLEYDAAVQATNLYVAFETIKPLDNKDINIGKPSAIKSNEISNISQIIIKTASWALKNGKTVKCGLPKQGLELSKINYIQLATSTATKEYTCFIK